MSKDTVDATIQERGKVYGSFKANANCTQNLMEMMEVCKQRQLDKFEREAIHMIFHKISRIVCGTKTKKDNWHDIAGYAKLAEIETKDE